jgi:hypothetical protein
VLTEAASGAYVVTPILAALAGAARVMAITRSSAYGSSEDVTRQTYDLAAFAGVGAGTIQVCTAKSAEIVQEADVITNSGHVRPIDMTMVALMKPTAVVSLMYESWEFRAGDVDLEACRQRGVCVAGTNERHPAIGVFSFLGVMAVKLLQDAGVAVNGSNVLLACDNPFAPFIESGLMGAGAKVRVVARILPGTADATGCDAVVIAARPGERMVVQAAQAALIAERWPGAVVAQFWGDIDRSALAAAGVPFWPVAAPRLGHMGILPSAIGPEAIVRLQCGGLKVGDILWRSRRQGATPEASIAAAVRSGFGMPVTESGGSHA